jgi:hypothetical protein
VFGDAEYIFNTLFAVNHYFRYPLLKTLDLRLPAAIAARYLPLCRHHSRNKPVA